MQSIYARGVARISFTSHLTRHVECPTAIVSGTTVAEVLASYFALHAPVRAYVLDEQSRLRNHVVIFVDGEQARDRVHLTDAVGAESEIYVMQALSGG
ncbi:MAG: thiamine S [Myxococcaceae bacterium]|nr:thiamine S [Myxococcaceae bacterium]